MDFKRFTIVAVYLAMCVLPAISSQTFIGETLKQESFCDPYNVTLVCSSDSTIALENVQLGFNSTRCSTQCCTFSIHDCIVPFNVKRVCSGQSTCSLSLAVKTDFCYFGKQLASYLYFEYFCIPRSRVTSICSNTALHSPYGQPLYLTNEGFPGVTVGEKSCTCSFEVDSCSSSTTTFIIDADLSRNTTNCNQQILFTDSKSSLLGTVGCESYYNAYITKTHFKTNYMQIDFINNSTQNLDGIFIMGFKASEANVSIRISCPAAQPSCRIDENFDCETTVESICAPNPVQENEATPDLENAKN